MVLIQYFYKVMKWPVYILLMAALTYLVETIRLPSYLAQQQETTKAVCCRMEKGKGRSM